MGRRRWFGSERREGGCFVVADQRRAQVDGKACNCEALNGKAQIDLGAREVVLPNTSWGVVGWHLLLLLGLTAVTSLWATSTFRAYQRSL